jgi:hypothetical protein
MLGPLHGEVEGADAREVGRAVADPRDAGDAAGRRAAVAAEEGALLVLQPGGDVGPVDQPVGDRVEHPGHHDVDVRGRVEVAHHHAGPSRPRGVEGQQGSRGPVAGLERRAHLGEHREVAADGLLRAPAGRGGGGGAELALSVVEQAPVRRVALADGHALEVADELRDGRHEVLARGRRERRPPRRHRGDGGRPSDQLAEGGRDGEGEPTQLRHVEGGERDEQRDGRRAAQAGVGHAGVAERLHGAGGGRPSGCGRRVGAVEPDEDRGRACRRRRGARTGGHDERPDQRAGDGRGGQHHADAR